MSSNIKNGRCLLAAVVLSSALFQGKSTAQPISPANDGTRTTVTPVPQAGTSVPQTRFEIRGGQVSHDGANLFHSFDRFGLDTGQSANFQSSPQIQNIVGRVMGGNASIINGLIEVTGGNSNLFLMNPAGIVFGPNARLNVPADFTATTATGIGFGDRWFNAIADNNWGTLVGTPNQFAFESSQPGAIANLGHLALSAGHHLTLLGGTIINNGTLSSPGGKITIAAVPGESLVRISQDDGLLSLEIANGAWGMGHGAWGMEMPAPQSLPELLTGGEFTHASTVQVNADGTVTLTGSGIIVPTNTGDAIASGEIDVSGEMGGTVHVLGQRVALIDAKINASGTNGGGTVLIGGDYQGRGSIPTALQTYVSGDTSIHADAIANGDGGRIILWADDTTRFYGNLSARGGNSVGNGGFVEVSGKEHLIFRGTADLSAVNGTLGTLLLDPTNIRIVSGEPGDNNNELDADVPNAGEVEGAIFANDGAGTFTISEVALENLPASANVILEASNDITIEDLEDNELTFAAGPGGAIAFTADADNDGVGSFLTIAPANDTIRAEGRDIEISGARIAVGKIDATTTGDITSGNITLTGDEIDLSGGANSVLTNTEATLTIQPKTPNQNIAIAFEENAEGSLTLTNADMAATEGLAGSVTIGRDNGAGTITIDTGGVNFYNPTTLRSPEAGGAIVVNGPITTAGQTLTLIAGNAIDINGNINTYSGDFTSTSANFNSEGFNISTSTSEGGSLTIDSSGDITTGTLSSVGGTSSGAPLNLTAGGNIITGDIHVRGRFGSEDMSITSKNGGITVGNIQSTAGDITLDANRDIITGEIESSAVIGGTIVLTSRNGSIKPSDIDASGSWADAGSIILNGNVTLTQPDTTFDSTTGNPDRKSGNITFNNLVNGTTPGEQNLTLNAGNGTVSFQGIGDSVPLGNVTMNTTENIQLTGDYRFPNDYTFDNPVNLIGDTTIAAENALTFNNTVAAGAHKLTLAGDEINWNNTVSGTGTLTLQPFTESQSIAIGGTVDNPGSLDLLDTEVALLQDFSGLVLGSGNGTGAIAVNNLVLPFPTTIESATGNISLSNLEGPNPLTVNSQSGNLTIDGTLGANTALDSLTVNTGGITTVNQNITVNGDIDFTGATGGSVLGADVAIATNEGNINFQNSPIAGRDRTVTLNAPTGTISLDSVGSAGNALGSLTIAAATDVHLFGDLFTQNGLNFTTASTVAIPNDSVTLATDTDNGAIDFTGVLLSGPGGLTLNAGSGQVSLGSIDSTLPLSFLDVNTTGAVNLGGEIYTTEAAGFAIAENSTLNLSAPVTIDTRSGNGAIALKSPVNGNFPLSLSAGSGEVTLAEVGQTTPLASLNVSTSGQTNLTGNITTQGPAGITIESPTTILSSAPVAIDTSRGNGAIAFNSTLSIGNPQLTLTGNEIDFAGAVSGMGVLRLHPATPEQNIAIGGAVETNGLDLTATEINFLQNGLSAIEIGRNDGTGTAIVNSATFADPITIQSPGGQIEVRGLLSGTDDATINLTGNAIALFQGIETTGTDITLQGNTSLNNDITVSTNGGNFASDGKIDGAWQLTLDAGTGTVQFNNDIGNTTALRGLSVTALNTELSSALNTTGDITFNSAITLLGNASVATTTGNISFNRAIDSTSAPFDLSLSADKGTIALNGAVGAAQPLGLLEISGATNVTADAAIAANRIDVTATQIQLNGRVNTTGGDVSVQASDRLITNEIVTNGGGIRLSNNNGNVNASNLNSSNPNGTGGEITLESPAGETLAGNINTSGATGGKITVLARDRITTANIDSFGTQGDGGNVFLDPEYNVEVGYINASGGNNGRGGNVEIITQQFFRASNTFRDRNGQEASISTVGGIGGGAISITHAGGDREMPFVVGDASTNGTAGAIASATHTLNLGESFLGPVTRGNIGVITSAQVPPEAPEPAPAAPTEGTGEQPQPFDPTEGTGEEPSPFVPTEGTGEQPQPFDPTEAGGEQPQPSDPTEAGGEQPQPNLTTDPTIGAPLNPGTIDTPVPQNLPVSRSIGLPATETPTTQSTGANDPTGTTQPQPSPDTAAQTSQTESPTAQTEAILSTNPQGNLQTAIAEIEAPPAIAPAPGTGIADRFAIAPQPGIDPDTNLQTATVEIDTSPAIAPTPEILEQPAIAQQPTVETETAIATQPTRSLTHSLLPDGQQYRAIATDIESASEEEQKKDNLYRNLSTEAGSPVLDSVVSSIEETFTADVAEHNRIPVPAETISLPQAQNIVQKIKFETGVEPALIYVRFVPTNLDDNKDNDQLEVILVTGTGEPIFQQIPNTTRAQVEEKVTQLRSQISQGLFNKSNRYLKTAKQFYEWLIAPIEPDLAAQNIQNLVFVMDLGLRTLPIAALHDGTGFIVEKYSVGMMPSLSLTDTRYADIKNLPVLAMGASEFSELAPLPGVPVEVQTITQKIREGEYFLNESFTFENIKRQRNAKNYGIVHLATHGQFKAGNISNSYIQLWDKKLKLNEMRQLGFHEPPVELLVLSACRTAIGDEQAELGFAGLAVQAGVKTAVASLWYVSDEGTFALMTNFYHQLSQAPIKAEALRQAQLAMIHGKVRIEEGILYADGIELALPPSFAKFKTSDLSHPYYWSAFTMIGSPW